MCNPIWYVSSCLLICFTVSWSTCTYAHAHTHNHFTALWTLSRITQVNQYHKAKTNLDLLEQEIVSGSDISWDICKSTPCPRQITCQHPTTQFFIGRMPFLPLNQQRLNWQLGGQKRYFTTTQVQITAIEWKESTHCRIFSSDLLQF